MKIIFKRHSTDWFLDHEITKALYINGKLLIAFFAATIYEFTRMGII